MSTLLLLNRPLLPHKYHPKISRQAYRVRIPRLHQESNGVQARAVLEGPHTLAISVKKWLMWGAKAEGEEFHKLIWDLAWVNSTTRLGAVVTDKWKLLKAHCRISTPIDNDCTAAPMVYGHILAPGFHSH